jgi:hypothetical protein
MDRSGSGCLVPARNRMMLAEISVAEIDGVNAQVERILHSEDFRSSEVLRRLLKFLAEKSISGEADELKEYVVAIDGLGKPSSYDPRHNSAVRIQVGRLRQKLADYYRGEGQQDPIIIDVPKGRFKLRFENRISVEIPQSGLFSDVAVEETTSVEALQTKPRKYAPRFLLRVFWVIFIGLICLVGYYWYRPSTAKAVSTSYPPGWNAEMDVLWRPFISTKRPLVVAIEDPLFVELNGSTGIYYRDRTLNTWSDIESSPNVQALRKALHSQDIEPSRYYTAFGEVDASFLIAKLLGPRVQNLLVVKTSDLSLRQIGDNNVLFVGVQNLFFDDQAQAMPIEPKYLQVREGILDKQPRLDEPALFADRYSTAPKNEGIAYALITHLPGPLGDNDVESFTSSRAAGYVAAVKAFTDPDLVRSIVGRLEQSCNGRMPRYYQVLLRVKFKEDFPTEIVYLQGRELR